MSDFFSLYSHEFVRVACCVPRTRVADAAYNLAETLKLAAQGDKVAGGGDGLSRARPVLLRRSRTCCCRTRCSTRSSGRSPRSVEASRELFPVLIVGAPLRVIEPPLQHAPSSIHRGRVLGVVPKTYLPNYREFYEKRHFVSGANVDHRRDRAGRAGRAVRHQPSVPGDRGSTSAFHVEICEDVWVPIPPSSHAAHGRRRSSLVNLSASNITIGKAEARRLLCGSQSMRAIAAYAYSASGPGEVDDRSRLGRPCRDLRAAATSSPRSTRFEKDSTLIHADVDLGRIRQERLRYSGLRRLCAAGAASVSTASGRIAFAFDPPKDKVALERAIERFPYVPSDPAKLRDNCYEAYNIQVQGLAQRLQSSRDGERRHRRVGRPRLDACADRHLPRDGSARPQPQERLRLHDAGLRHLGQNPHQCLAADEGAGRHGRRDRHQAGGDADAGRHRPSVRPGREGLRRHLRERAGGPAHRLSVPAGQPAARHGGRHGRSVRARPRLVHLRRGRSHVPLQSQRLGLQDADPAPDPLRRGVGRRRARRRPTSCTTS